MAIVNSHEGIKKQAAHSAVKTEVNQSVKKKYSLLIVFSFVERTSKRLWIKTMSSPSKQNYCTLPAKKSALKETVDLLRRQAKMQRMKVSRTAEEIMNYCLENAQDDCLLQGIPTGGNPYKEGKNCPVM